MPLTFNALLRSEGVDPAEVRLLRHETKRYRGRTPYSLWREDPDSPVRLERYQSTQRADRRAWFRGRYWASFVVAPDASTLFVGLYEVGDVRPVPAGWLHDLNDLPLDPAVDELYDLAKADPLRDYAGRLAVDWAAGARSWVQLAGNQDKTIVELRRTVIDPPFPGFAGFVRQLSEIEAMPRSWRDALSATGGVYLLTCPRTREQYVGSATGRDGFIGRWREYLDGGDGGNAGLRSREPADYRVSILQSAGSADDREAVLAMEALWKEKLQSREMGLNKN